MKKLLTGLIMIFAFSSAFSQITGTWKVASQPGSLGVGPSQGDISWWSIDAGGIIQRDCFFDDKFVFNEDGTFQNEMDGWTWVEAWQGVSADQCDVPVYPHDGSNAATWAYDEGAATLTLSGVGAHLGLPKVVNGMELTDPSQAPESITYIVTELTATAMTIDIAIDGGWWRYIMTKDAGQGEDASLSDLQVDGSTIPGFAPGVLTYTYPVPEGTSEIPQITSAVPNDPEVSALTITQATAIPGDATVEVISANGNVTNVYTVSFEYSFEVNLPVTFEENIDYGLLDFGGNFSEVIEDPTDPSNHVAKTIKTDGAELWAGTTIGGTVGFAQPIPFEEGYTVMTARVWSPDADIQIRLKVEDTADPTISVETEATITAANAWNELTFDFSNEAPGTEPINFANSYQKASIFFNFGVEGSAVGEKTYYWDDMDFDGSGVEPKPYLALNVQDNFEDDGWGTITTWQFQDPDLVPVTIVADPMGGTNQVLDYSRSGSFEWTNAQFILDHRMNLTERNTFEVKAYFPSSNDYSGDLNPTLALKLQNSLLGGEAWTTQTEVILEVEDFDQWVTLEFDFGVAADRDDYDQMVVQFGGEGHFVPGQFYLDDLELLGDPISVPEINQQQMSIYPNPAVNMISIEQHQQLSSFEMFNITGQKVLYLDNVPQQIQVGHLPEGVYTIIANDINGHQLTSKVVIR